MIRLAKRSIIQLLNHAGYVVLRKTNYERLVSTAAPPPPPSPPAQQPTDAHVAVKPQDPPGALDLKPESDFARFAAGAGSSCKLPVERLLALYSAARYLIDAGVQGAVLDCGHGSTANLEALVRAFVHFGDTSRSVVLFDTSADPTHRAETELELWGTARDRLSPDRIPAKQKKPEPAPAELAATGYPPEKLSVMRYPREAIAGFGPLAFLGLTTQTYPSNLQAMATFFPHLARGGVVAIESNQSDPDRPDAFDEFLRNERLPMLLARVAGTYRIGHRP